MIRTVVVDDDFRVAGLHADVVAGLPGFEVAACVHTAAAAEDAVARHRPALVLCDLYLPDRPGLELVRALAAMPDPPDVIVVSAARDRGSVRAAMRAGAAAFLVKPVDFGELGERLAAWAATRARGTDADVLDQREVDRLYAESLRPASGGTASPDPAAESPTGERVLAALREGGGPLAAAQVADAVGISRATAQRYLAGFVRTGHVELTLRYGSTGRPEHRYSVTGR